MGIDHNSNACVQVKLELGHKATIRTQPTAEGFTHDWAVFVRGPEGSNIQHFVERVVFLLHESFPKPKRVVKEPPYLVSESGYAGFLLPIEVYFKTKEEPKKIQFQYDLFLHLEGPPINHIRCEKLTFQNPTEDFRRKLIKAGGVGVLGPEGGTVLSQAHHRQPSTHPPETPLVTHVGSSKPKPEPVEGSKVSRASIPSKEGSRLPVLPSTPQSFEDLFGQPIKANKLSPDSQKLKDGQTKVPAKTPKPLQLPVPPSFSSSSSASTSLASCSVAMPAACSSSQVRNSTKETKGSVPKTAKDGSKEAKCTHGGKDGRVISKHSPSPPDLVQNTDEASISNPLKKRKRSLSPSSGTSVKSKDKTHKEKRKSGEKKIIAKEKEKEKVKRDKKEKEKVKSSTRPVDEKIVEKVHIKSEGEKRHPDHDKTTLGRLNTKKDDKKRDSSPALGSNIGSIGLVKSKKRKPLLEPFPPSPPRHSLLPDDVECRDASPDSSNSFSSLHLAGGKGPLELLMAELEDQEDEDDLLSPLSSDPDTSPRQLPEKESKLSPSSHSHAIQVTPQEPSIAAVVTVPPSASKVLDKQPKKEKKAKVKQNHNGTKTHQKPLSSSSSSSLSSTSSLLPLNSMPPETGKQHVKEIVDCEFGSSVGVTENYITELKELQQRIMSLRDRTHLQQIVNVIEETGLYKVTRTTFDFDLCVLDRTTVRKLQSCLAAVV